MASLYKTRYDMNEHIVLKNNSKQKKYINKSYFFKFFICGQNFYTRINLPGYTLRM